MRNLAAGRVFLIGLTLAAMAGAAAAATQAAPTHDPAKQATVVKILDNLGAYDLLVFGSKQGFQTDDGFKTLPAGDQTLLLSLMTEELGKRRQALLNDMASTDCDAFTTDQLKDLLAMSKIKYVHDLMMSKGDPSRPAPDPASMTASEKALYDRLDQATFAGDFLNNIGYNNAVDDLKAADQAAIDRYKAAKAAPGKAAS